MVNVIGVRFQNAGKLYFFDPGAFWPTPGDFVIVETARGIEFGEVVTPVREMNDEQLAAPLKQVVRIANAQDVQHAQENKQNEKEAYAICQKKISEHKLDMKLVSVEYTFDNSKILFYFTANGRVDFRSLVKDLAAVFKTRIELRQIGVRDEAKMLGGLGPCGRPVCCGAFLGDFQPVSIKMAKEQNLSLNPTKISGVCGRLMCCLKYEQDNYEQTRKRMPKVGKEVITPEGNGVVWDLNIIKETVRVRIQKGDSSELKDFPLEEVQRVGGPAQQSRREAPAEEPEVDAVQTKGEDELTEPEDNVIEKVEQPRREQREKQLGKPVMRENPNRKEQGEKTERNERKPKPQRQNVECKPAEAPSEKPAQEPAAKPAVSPWKQAVEAALKAAQEEKK
ncbi:MAG: stage 0 sporulation protein [Clostridia bacterium]|nr:stage 0 sporulation protein [Clostridia bacterium]